METEKLIQFDGTECAVLKQKYAVNGSPRIDLISPTEGPYSTITVYLETVKLADDEVALNGNLTQDMIKDLVIAKIIHIPHRYVRQGFGRYPVCRLKI